MYLQMAPDFVPYAINHPEAARRRRARDWFLRTLDYAQAAGARHVTTLQASILRRKNRPSPGAALAANWDGASNKLQRSNHLWRRGACRVTGAEPRSGTTPGW